MKILFILTLSLIACLQSAEGFGWLGGAVLLPKLRLPSFEHGLRAGIFLRARVLWAPVRHRGQDKWVLSGKRFEDSEEPEDSELGSFDARQFSALSKNSASASVSDNSWKSLTKIFVLLFNARTDNEGICELKTMNRTKSLVCYPAQYSPYPVEQRCSIRSAACCGRRLPFVHPSLTFGTEVLQSHLRSLNPHMPLPTFPFPCSSRSVLQPTKERNRVNHRNGVCPCPSHTPHLPPPPCHRPPAPPPPSLI
jgi:hypothetical protein